MLPIRACLFFNLASLKLPTPASPLSIVLISLILFHQTATGSDEADQTMSDHSEFGRQLSDAEIARLQSQVFADGEGLPIGSGNVQAGSKLYQQHCSNCHGSRGEGASSIELIGDRETLGTQYPDKGIAVYWPYAPTLYGYIQRAMPPDKPNLFTVNELYSLVAYVLHLNNLIAEEATLDQTSLGAIQLPNRQGFTDVYP